ncbi:MAG: hypothetical protein HQ480_04315 [Candidatus Pelagibacter sp.]|nr:hypothetical protein [Candidatus Pelagibacter sp.]
MLKELKYLFFILMISLFFFLSFKYYFSDNNKKNSYRSFKEADEKIATYSKKLVLLNNDTNDVLEYLEKRIDKNKKSYNFWKLINNNE